MGKVEPLSKAELQALGYQAVLKVVRDWRDNKIGGDSAMVKIDMLVQATDLIVQGVR